MVGTEMRHQDAGQCRTAKETGKDRVPVRAGIRQRYAAVHGGPPLLFPHQPQVDVIKRERQWHAQPVHPHRDLENTAWSGWLSEWETHPRIETRRENNGLHWRIPVRKGGRYSGILLDAYVNLRRWPKPLTRLATWRASL